MTYKLNDDVPVVWSLPKDLNRWRPRVLELARAIHAHPEVSFEEEGAAQAITGLFEPVHSRMLNQYTPGCRLICFGSFAKMAGFLTVRACAEVCVSTAVSCVRAVHDHCLHQLNWLSNSGVGLNRGRACETDPSFSLLSQVLTDAWAGNHPPISAWEEYSSSPLYIIQGSTTWLSGFPDASDGASRSSASISIRRAMPAA
jgi:hypothetical protein